MKRQGAVLILIMILLTLTLSGCQNMQVPEFFKKNDREQQDLIAVRIHFDRGDMVDGYVSELGVEKSGKLYAGGSSLSYIYDADGNVVGSFNYQRVTYMQILPVNDENLPQPAQ